MIFVSLFIQSCSQSGKNSEHKILVSSSFHDRMWPLGRCAPEYLFISPHITMLSIYSCVFVQVDLPEPNHVQVKPQPMSSSLKIRFVYGHVGVDSIGRKPAPWWLNSIKESPSLSNALSTQHQRYTQLRSSFFVTDGH